MTDIIEYDNEYIIKSDKQFLDAFIEQLMDALQSDDGNLVNYACQSFQIIIRSGYITTTHIRQDLIECINREIENCKTDVMAQQLAGSAGGASSASQLDSNKKEKLGYLLQIISVIRKSVSQINTVRYMKESWNHISSLMNQIQLNPSFLTRTPSMIYTENMDIGQPLLLSPSLRSHSVSSLQRQNSLTHIEPLNGSSAFVLSASGNNNNMVYNHTNSNSVDMLDID